MNQQSRDQLQEALRLSGCDTPAARAALLKIRDRSITRRGVLWLGQTCNLRCQFCYFIDRVAERSHPEHAFMPLDKARAICRTLVDFYGNSAVDLQGGEPTLYPGIFELVRYCDRIGLAPTLISNALLLDNAELCQRYRDAGVRDFLISVQGLGEVHDLLVGCPGAHRRQMAALGHLRRLGIPFRFNVVMSKPALPQLPDISRLAVASGARVVNFITFNPFADQAQGGHRSVRNVPRYSEVAPYLTQALDLLEQSGIEANVRYFPICMVEERHRKNVYNFQQLPYDPHEWDFASWGWTGLQPQRIAAGSASPPTALAAPCVPEWLRAPLKKLGQHRLLAPLLYAGYSALTRSAAGGGEQAGLYRRIARLHAEQYCGYRQVDQCGVCSLRLICDGLHGDYLSLLGVAEARPVQMEQVIDDPLHYINKQEKILPVCTGSASP